MGKLVIKNRGKLVGDVNLKLGDMKIGRKTECDIVLDDPAVSGEHAVIKTVGLKSSIEDLDSTNGTFIDNKRVREHALRHGDEIIIGAHTLVFREEANIDTAPAVGKRPGPPPAPSREQEKTKILTAFAQLLAIDGKDKGKRLPLVKDEVVLDNPGKNPARVLRTSEGYVVHAQVGPGEPRVNGKPVPPGGQLLEKGDILEIAGSKLQFFS